jgi:NADH-quinone oxidoreductase subunit C
MAKIDVLAARVQEKFKDKLTSCDVSVGELTIVLPRENLLEVCTALRDEPEFAFQELIDLCGVDYSTYGEAEWVTEKATGTGFSRGVERSSDVSNIASKDNTKEGQRFAVVYHLLSVTNNQRLRIRVFANGEPPVVDSVMGIWASANWYEREAFDLFGILFEGHPDLRRILTDYGFIGHPFRKDFPLIGNVEMRYDAEKQRTIYEPVSIEPRVLVPKVIRDDHRYVHQAEGEK